MEKLEEAVREAKKDREWRHEYIKIKNIARNFMWNMILSKNAELTGQSIVRDVLPASPHSRSLLAGYPYPQSIPGSDIITGNPTDVVFFPQRYIHIVIIAFCQK